MTTEKVTIMCSCGNGYETDVTHEFTNSDPPVHQENAKKSCPYCGATYHSGHVMEKRLIRLKDNPVCKDYISEDYISEDYIWEDGTSDHTGDFEYLKWIPTDTTTTTITVSADDWLRSSLACTSPLLENQNWMLDGVIH